MEFESCSGKRFCTRELVGALFATGPFGVNAQTFFFGARKEDEMSSCFRRNDAFRVSRLMAVELRLV